MDAHRKPRSDSALKTLPEERQAQVAAMLASRSLADVRAELAKDGLVTSSAALSEFWSWWQLREALRRRENRVASILEQVQTETPAVAPEKLFQLGQSLFGAMAIAEEDGRAWYNTQRLALKRQEIDLDRERFEVDTCQRFLKWLHDQRALEIADGKATNSEKIAALRQLMFADIEGVTPA